MSKVFYDDLVIREEIYAELDRYQLSIDDREEFERLADETLHHEVLNIILTKLPKEKHREFLQKFHASPGDPDILEYLKSEISDIEDQIKTIAKKIKRELLIEIKRATKY